MTSALTQLAKKTVEEVFCPAGYIKYVCMVFISIYLIIYYR